MKYFGDAPSDNVDTEALGIISDFVQQFTKVRWSASSARALLQRFPPQPSPPPPPQVLAEVSALEKKKIAAEEAKKRREALQLQRAKAAAAAAPFDAAPQSAVSGGSEGSGGAGFTSPTLGPKAQAAVDSARDVVRRVLVNKVRVETSIATQRCWSHARMHVHTVQLHKHC